MTDPSQKRKIFDALAAALAAEGRERVPLPEYADSCLVSASRLREAALWDNFAANFRAVNGLPMRTVAALAGFLRDGGYRKGFCDPALRPEIGSLLEREDIEVLYNFEHGTARPAPGTSRATGFARIDDYAFAITRASGAIAESGSLILNDHDTCDRLAALAPWVHVAVLREADLLRTLPEAVTRLGPSTNVVWVTGPSKTADIEGILVEGVHGPGVQICLCLP